MTLWYVIPAMDLVVDFLSVAGPDNEIVVNEISEVEAGVLQTYHFDRATELSTSFPECGDTQRSVSSPERDHIPLFALPAILRNTFAGHALLYSYDRKKCGFLSALVGPSSSISRNSSAPSPTN
jgi:hypothetical protein